MRLLLLVASFLVACPRNVLVACVGTLHKQSTHSGASLPLHIQSHSLAHATASVGCFFSRCLPPECVGCLCRVPLLIVYPLLAHATSCVGCWCMVRLPLECSVCFSSEMVRGPCGMCLLFVFFFSISASCSFSL